MAENQAVKHQADERERSRRSSPAAELEAPTHPLLALQQTAGNRAVQRLVATGGRPAQIQRVLSPGTYGMGMGAYANLISGWSTLAGQSGALVGSTANVMTSAIAANTQATGAYTQAMGLLPAITSVLNFVTIANAEPAPASEPEVQVPATGGV
jgi:hypothetical protein